MVFEVWSSEDGLYHWQLVENGHVFNPQNSYRRRLDCNNAIARQRELYPDAQIALVETPTKGEK